VLLEPGKTVEGVVRENLSSALRKAGYDVRDQGNAGSSPIFIDARIRKFWAWLTPGFWAVTLRANVETDLAISGGNPAVNVSVTAEQAAMVAGGLGLVEVIDSALRLTVTGASKTPGSGDAAVILEAAAAQEWKRFCPFPRSVPDGAAYGKVRMSALRRTAEDPPRPLPPRFAGPSIVPAAISPRASRPAQ